MMPLYNLILMEFIIKEQHFSLFKTNLFQNKLRVREKLLLKGLDSND